MVPQHSNPKVPEHDTAHPSPGRPSRPLCDPWMPLGRWHGPGHEGCAAVAVHCPPVDEPEVAMQPKPAVTSRLLHRIAALCVAWAALGCSPQAVGQPAATPAAATAPYKLRIVGGLAGINQYTRQEEPFWSKELLRLSGGRFDAEIVPFDRAGVPGAEMLRLLQLGVVPFGTTLMSSFTAQYPEYTAADLAGRRTRVSSSTQADFVGALGGIPVLTGFAQIVPSLTAGNTECAITGTMSGNTLGLHTMTSHVHALPVTWGLAVFSANKAAWEALPPDLRALLRRELPRLEAAIWEESERETSDGM